MKCNKHGKHINVKCAVRMQEYVKRLWAAFHGLTEESLPLLGRRREAREAEDLEAFAQGGSERVVVVCEVCEPAEVRVQVSPFSEEHFL